MNKGFNGHRNWNHWNVSLWMNNDEALYQWMADAQAIGGDKNTAARMLLSALREAGITHTPDGAPYSVSAIRAAMRN